MSDARGLVQGIQQLMVSVSVYMTTDNPLEARNARADATERAEALARWLDEDLDARIDARLEGRR